jgi:hypothetical protein
MLRFLIRIIFVYIVLIAVFALGGLSAFQALGLQSRRRRKFYICSSRLGLIEMDHRHSGNGRNSRSTVLSYDDQSGSDRCIIFGIIMPLFL